MMIRYRLMLFLALMFSTGLTQGQLVADKKTLNG